MRYYIIAGEASGDLHGANLMTAIRSCDPQAEFRFWGGDRMAAVGGTPVRHIKDTAVMGFVEVVSHLGQVTDNLRFCKKDLLEYAPDVLVCIDYPGFNLKIAKFAHQHGIPVCHYISPQIWAWKKGRIKAMRRDIDQLCYILPFEQDFYAKNHFPQASFVGHPLIDEVAKYQGQQESKSDKPIIALLPGSRRQEVERVLPRMAELASRHPEYHFRVAAMSLLGEDFYRGVLSGCRPSNLDCQIDNTYGILSEAYAAVVCSGTATLEAALFHVPQIVCYRANAVSIAVARVLLSIKYISLVNLIADAPVVKELIQHDMNIRTLDHEFSNICVNASERERISEGYRKVENLLGNEGASLRTAQIIVSCARRQTT